MSNYFKALDQEEWSKHYNMDSLNYVVSAVATGNVSIWSKELINITNEKEKILEIGCGTGMSSLWLGSHNREVTALDYTESSIALVRSAAQRVGGGYKCKNDFSRCYKRIAI